MPKMMKNVQQMSTMLPMGFREERRVWTTSLRPGARLMTLRGRRALTRRKTLKVEAAKLTPFFHSDTRLRHFRNISFTSRSQISWSVFQRPPSWGRPPGWLWPRFRPSCSTRWKSSSFPRRSFRWRCSGGNRCDKVRRHVSISFSFHQEMFLSLPSRKKRGDPKVARKAFPLSERMVRTYNCPLKVSLNLIFTEFGTTEFLQKDFSWIGFRRSNSLIYWQTKTKKFWLVLLEATAGLHNRFSEPTSPIELVYFVIKTTWV